MCMLVYIVRFYFFFFNDTATTEIYTLSLHDALPIFSDYWAASITSQHFQQAGTPFETTVMEWDASSYSSANPPTIDRKSTRLNSSHANISYAVFCLKKKKTHPTTYQFTSILTQYALL